MQLCHVPYKGAMQSLTDLMTGQVMLVADTPPTVLPHIKAKKMRAIATSMVKRIPQLPDVPTVDEQGVKGYDLNTWTSIVAPKATPDAILERLNSEIVKIIAQPDVNKRLIEMGFIPVGSSARAVREIPRCGIRRLGEDRSDVGREGRLARASSGRNLRVLHSQRPTAAAAALKRARMSGPR